MPVKEASYTLASLTRSSVGSDELSSLQSSFKAANFIYIQIQKIHKCLGMNTTRRMAQLGKLRQGKDSSSVYKHGNSLGCKHRCCPVSRQWTFPTVTQHLSPMYVIFH